jgi:hypothetical protein
MVMGLSAEQARRQSCSPAAAMAAAAPCWPGSAAAGWRRRRARSRWRAARRSRSFGPGLRRRPESASKLGTGMGKRSTSDVTALGCESASSCSPCCKNHPGTEDFRRISRAPAAQWHAQQISRRRLRSTLVIHLGRRPHERRPFSSKGTGAVEGAAPSLVSGRLGVGRMDIAHPIFGPRKHVAKETPHDLGGLVGSPSLDRDLDRD